MKNLFKKNVSYVLCTMLFAAMTLATGCGKTADNVALADSAVTTEVSVSETTTASVEEVVSSTEVSVSSEEISTLESEAVVIESREGCELGEGETQFTFVVVDKEKNETTFTVNTNETTVGAALVAVNLIAGDESEWGLYVKNVNGIVADYDVDQTYWAFYIDDAYASTGVDATEITAGSTYSFKVE